MGFPDSSKITVSDTQAYKPFGKAVAVQVDKAIARKLLPYIEKANSGKTHTKHGKDKKQKRYSVNNCQ